MKSISFSNPWFLLAILPLIFLTVLPFLRLAKKRRTKKFLVSVVLRSAAILLIVLMLAGMSSISSTDDVSIVVLADLSDSTVLVQSDIEDFISELIQETDSNIKLVLFADSCVYEAEVDSELNFDDLSEEPASDATDIEEALRYASSLLDTETCGRIILLSDGEQTNGEAEAAAAEIAYQGTRIDAVYFDTEIFNEAEVQINDVEMLGSIYSGNEFDITITAQSSIDTDGTIFVYDDDIVVGEFDVSVSEGINTYTFEFAASGSGVHLFMIELSVADDNVSENNTYYSYIKVLGDPNILIVDGTGSESTLLAQVLSDEYGVTVVSESEVPTSIINLINYEEVILMNVSNTDLPSGFDELLEVYINVFGRGVLTTGGTDTYYYGSMDGTVFEDFLPVDINLGDSDEDAKTTALVILIDSSSSMTGTYYELAKESTINCVNALSDTDYVGIIAFADKSYVVSELTLAENKEEIISDISELQTIRGTYLCDAVNEAYDQLKDSNADVKHVIIISDGNPSDSGYDSVVKDMYASDITTSTILIGDGTNSQMGGGQFSMSGSSTTSEIMEGLAELGGGDYYHVENVSDLPDIMLEETEQYLTNYINEGTFTLEINNISQALSNVDDVPNITGYTTSEIKSTASCVLYTDDNRPIYAEWNYGNGSVASFMSDLSGDWSSSFYSSEDGITFIKNIVDSLLPSQSDLEGMDVTISQNGRDTTLTVEALDTSEDSVVSASIISPNDEEFTITLNKNGEGVYSNTTAFSNEGVYTVLVMQSDSEGSTIAYSDTAFAVSYSAEYDEFVKGGEDLLASVSEITGGEVMTDTDDILDAKIDDVEIEKSLLLPLGILAALLILSDLIIRNAKWKDIKELFIKMKLNAKKGNGAEF